MAILLSSEGATYYESFLHRKPCRDYTPDYTVCQLVFDLLTERNVIVSGRQVAPNRSSYTTISACYRMHDPRISRRSCRSIRRV